jgi:hypothetical protein
LPHELWEKVKQPTAVVKQVLPSSLAFQIGYEAVNQTLCLLDLLIQHPEIFLRNVALIQSYVIKVTLNFPTAEVHHCGTSTRRCCSTLELSHLFASSSVQPYEHPYFCAVELQRFLHAAFSIME